jgi:hypothetical protein
MGIKLYGKKTLLSTMSFSSWMVHFKGSLPNSTFFLIPTGFMLHALVCQLWNVYLAIFEFNLQKPLPISPQICPPNHPFKNPRSSRSKGQWQQLLIIAIKKTMLMNKIIGSSRWGRWWWHLLVITIKRPWWWERP